MSRQPELFIEIRSTKTFDMKTLFYCCIFITLSYSIIAQKVTIKDADDHVLIEINDEDTSGSITILPGPVPSDVDSKLYNVGNSLYWRGTKLGTTYNAGGWIVEGGNVYLSDQQNKVGIGSINPLSKLYVEEGTIQVNMGYISSSGVSDYGIYTRNDWLTEGALARRAFGSELNPVRHFYGVLGTAYDGTGTRNIGVYGSASAGEENWAGFFEGGEGGEPIAKFESFPIGTHGAIRIQNAADNHFNIGTVQDPTNAFAINYNANIGALTDLMRINPDGKVGFGTTSPTGNLQVEGDTTSGVSLMIHNLNDAGSERLWFGTSSASDASITVWGSDHLSNPGKFRFFNNKTGANYDWITNGLVRMTLANDGDLGIGTETPTAKTHIFQDGSGNAFRVDDETSDASPFLINSSGNVRIGNEATDGSKFHLEKPGFDVRLGFPKSVPNDEFHAIYGESSTLGIITNVGVQGIARNAGTNNYGVIGTAEGAADFNYGVWGKASGATGANFAGVFIGAVQINGLLNVTGILSKGGGSFKIDHPLDPENKYLYHSFVESPDMMNIYNGNVIMDQNGRAVVEMPEWFNALNKEFRYQLTAIGAPGPNLYIADKMNGNQFRIAGGSPGMEVSWQVTGIRKDAFAEQNRIQVEVDKSAVNQGSFLHPDAFGKPETMKEGYELFRMPN
jgi:hypothetical protein